MEDEVKALAATPLFKSVDPTQLRLISMMAELRRYEDGERIIRQGEEAAAAFVVLEGVTEVFIELDGHEQAVAEIGENDIIGEMGVLNNHRRSASVRAKGPVCVLRIAQSDMLSLVRQFPELALEMLRVISKRLTATTRQLILARNDED